MGFGSGILTGFLWAWAAFGITTLTCGAAMFGGLIPSASEQLASDIAAVGGVAAVAGSSAGLGLLLFWPAFSRGL